MENNKRHKDKQKKKKIRTRNSSALTVLVIFVAAYIAINSLQLFKKSVQHETIEIGRIENKIHAEAVIVRDEESIYSPASGYTSIHATEGIKLGKGSEVVSVSSNKNTSILTSKIDSLNQQIYEIQKLRKSVSTVKKDIDEINLGIQDSLENIKKVIARDDYQSAYSNIGKLEQSLQKKNAKFEAETTGDSNLSGIIQQKNKYENEMNNLSKTILMPIPGILSYQSDGLEEKLPIEQIATIDTESIVNKSQEHIYKLKDVTKQQDFLFRVVDPYQWYIAAHCASQDSKLKIGERVKVRFIEKQTVLQGTVFAINKLDKNTANIIICLSSDVNKFLNDRKISVDIIFQDYEGLKVPNRAIVEKNFLKIPKTALMEQEYKEGVYILKNKERKFTPIYYYNKEGSDLYIPSDVDQISVHDVILKDPQNSDSERFEIKDIVAKKGIYVLSAGVSQFKTIEPIIQNDSYTIVKPGDYRGIQIYDQAIINPSKIHDQQLIKR